MKERTDEEIVAKCEQLWPDATAYGWYEVTPAVRVTRDGAVIKITVGAMYADDAPRLTFEAKLALSEFFDTMLVEELHEFESSYGCDTCEYGGAHGFVARIEPGAPYDPSVAKNAASL
jgi:hypothetical protein